MDEQLQNNKNSIDDAVIVAGGNVSFGDNTGQIAIGKYISQIMIKEPSGEALVELMIFLDQKRKEAVNLKILNSYNPSFLPNYPSKLKEFVTRNRIEELNKALMYLQDHRILLFTGIGGVGKTTLARALVDVRPAYVPLSFWFDFGQNKDAKLGDILEKLAAYMNCPDLAKFREEKREAEKKDIDNLTGKLQAGNPVWLIFDNLETILDDIYFHDEYIDLFFTCLRNNTHQTKIIITSRVSPKLKNGEDLIDVIEEEKQDVKGLKTNFAVEYLVKNGLSDLDPNKLEELTKGVDGHPLALKLLVGLVKDFGAEDILEDLSIYQEHKENTILKARKLFDKLAGNEKALLERISVYREPVKIKGLKEMFMENASLTDIKKLMNKSLLETDINGNYWLHPLVQEFSYEDLKNKKEAHMYAVNYYFSLPLPENPSKKEDLEPALEAYYHACEAGEYDLAMFIIWQFNFQGFLDLWGNQRILTEIYEKLLQKDHFNGETVLNEQEANKLIFGNLGLSYLNLGEPKKAINYIEQALTISREIGDRSGEGTDLGNLGLSYLHLGEPKKAIKYIEQALTISREIGNKRGEGAALVNLGFAYSNLGEPRKAIKYYKQGLTISREIGDKRGEGKILGNMGLEYNHLGELKKVIKHYDQALTILREIGDRPGEGKILGYIGNAYLYLSEPKKAIKYIEQALTISREIGDKFEEGSHLGSLGTTYAGLGELKTAIKYYDQALTISREIGDRHGEGIRLANIGSAYSQLGELKTAIKYYEQALIISRKIGDRRGEGNRLKNLGIAYLHLSELKKAIEFLKESLVIGKSIEDQNIINFCEHKLKELDGFS